MRGLVAIPAYQELENLPRLFEAIRGAGLDQTILVVDDGSTDGTAAWLAQRGVAHVRHPFNQGYTVTMETGIRYALACGYDYVVFLDADGQHDPADVSRLVRAHAEGADVVIGSRFLSGYSGQPFARSLGARLFSWVTVLFGHRIRDTSSGFKLLSRRALELSIDRSFGDYHAEFLLYLSRLGLVIAEVPIAIRPRERGQSMHGWVSLFYYPVKTLLLLIEYGLAKPRRRVP